MIEYLTPIAVVLIIYLLCWWKMLTVVPFNEVHVISKKKKVAKYDGRGRYLFFGLFQSRTIIPKHVLDIEPGLLDLHDKDNLPFGVEVSIKVQVSDPEKAASTLVTISHSTVSKVVEDTVMSALRSVAMERTILEVMKLREEIEQDVYAMVTDALSKLGLNAIIFDIKNIKDVEGKDVIRSLERKKIAELEKDARMAEAINSSLAKQVEVEKEKEANVKIAQMHQEEEQAELERQQMNVEAQRNLVIKQLEIEEAKKENQKKLKNIEAETQANIVIKKAQSEANSVSIRAKAEADAIREKGLAEITVMEEKAKALKSNPLLAQMEMVQYLSQAQVAAAGKIAEALGQNNKIMYLPSEGNMLSNFIPSIEGILESGTLEKIAKQLGLNKNN